MGQVVWCRSQAAMQFLWNTWAHRGRTPHLSPASYSARQITHGFSCTIGLPYGTSITAFKQLRPLAPPEALLPPPSRECSSAAPAGVNLRDCSQQECAGYQHHGEGSKVGSAT
jgi:hypothetical protein